jgi:hypothetical protein
MIWVHIARAATSWHTQAWPIEATELFCGWSGAPVQHSELRIHRI